jgi:hypothetical protein
MSIKPLVLALFVAVGCGSVEATNPDGAAADAATPHATPWCPTPAEAIAAGTGLNQAGTVLSHMDLPSNPTACAGPGPFGMGLQPGQDWRFSDAQPNGAINVPVTQGFVPCPDDQGGCLTSITFTPTATTCTYVWQFKYFGYTDVGLCCETITASVVNPLSPATVSQ